MTTPHVSATKATVVFKKSRQVQRLQYHHISDFVVAACTVFICAAAPAIAIPVPPGVGAGTATASTAGGPRRPGPIAMSADQPPGCPGVVAQPRMIHR
jgi:hypothetical protein